MTHSGRQAADSDGVGRRVERICRMSLGSAGVDGAGVALVGAQGHRATVCATDDIAAAIEEAQFTLGEGPCVDAASARSPVLIDDLSDRAQAVQGRWPGFMDAAAMHGVRAVFAFPLRIGATSIGALDFYRRTPGPLDDTQLRVALLAADDASLALVDGTAARDGLTAGSATHATFRLAVHGAAGMVKVQLGTTIEDALVQLRAVAYAQGRGVDEVATDVLRGRLRFPQEDP